MLQAQLKLKSTKQGNKKRFQKVIMLYIVQEEGIKLVGKAEAAMQDVHDMNYDTVGLPEHIGMLNEDQKRVFESLWSSGTPTQT